LAPMPAASPAPLAFEPLAQRASVAEIRPELRRTRTLGAESATAKRPAATNATPRGNWLPPRFSL
jgi:hypothetical protein